MRWINPGSSPTTWGRKAPARVEAIEESGDAHSRAPKYFFFFFNVFSVGWQPLPPRNYCIHCRLLKLSRMISQPLPRGAGVKSTEVTRVKDNLSSIVRQTHMRTRTRARDSHSHTEITFPRVAENEPVYQQPLMNSAHLQKHAHTKSKNMSGPLLGPFTLKTQVPQVPPHLYARLRKSSMSYFLLKLFFWSIFLLPLPTHFFFFQLKKWDEQTIFPNSELKTSFSYICCVYVKMCLLVEMIQIHKDKNKLANIGHLADCFDRCLEGHRLDLIL